MGKVRLNPGPHLRPVPCVLVSSSDGEVNNIITIAWTGIMASDPPTVGVGIRKKQYSHGLISTSGEFVMNLPRADQVELVSYCGQVSGRQADKFADLGLTPIRAATLKHAPAIAECPVNLECKVKQVLELGSHDYFIAEVSGIQADEEFADRDGDLPTYDFGPMVYLQGEYYGLGDKVGSR